MYLRGTIGFRGEVKDCGAYYNTRGLGFKGCRGCIGHPKPLILCIGFRVLDVDDNHGRV